MTQQVATIYDIMRQVSKYPGNRYRGDFGVEIETESDKKYDYPSMKYWRTEKDNSLRDWGVEYVLKEPMSLPEFEKALIEFSEADKKFKFKKSSVSTSIHVHVNMLNETFLTMANFLTAYVLVENILIRYSGPDRLSNLFCLPVCDAEGVKDHLYNLLSNINRNMFNKLRVSADRCKYGAVNPAPLSEIGTIEIRSFRGETDTKVIQKWLEIIDKLKTYARQPNLTPMDILEQWRKSKDTILEVIFQEYATELRVKDKDRKDITAELIRQNVKYAADLACVSKDWTKFGILKIKPVYKEKIMGDLNQIAQDKFKTAFDNLQYAERQVVMERYHIMNNNVRLVNPDDDI